ncbi:MAG: hypothetical protein LM580_11865, partial [Thermofilum sp.]|nr:hypothetical protein [Thermofilum sp.]
LLALKTKYKDDPKIAQDVDILVTKLQYLRLRDLHSFFALVHEASSDCEEFLSILPTEEEVEEWYGKGEGE